MTFVVKIFQCLYLTLRMVYCSILLASLSSSSSSSTVGLFFLNFLHILHFALQAPLFSRFYNLFDSSVIVIDFAHLSSYVVIIFSSYSVPSCTFFLLNSSFNVPQLSLVTTQSLYVSDSRSTFLSPILPTSSCMLHPVIFVSG